MLNKFLPLISSIILMYSGYKLFTINKGRTNEEFKVEQKMLCEKGVKTMAILQNQYTEMEIGSSVSYQYKFDYIVDDKTYTGSVTKEEELEIPILEITYNPNNPDSYSTKEACVVYATVKDNPARRPQWFEYIGFGMMFLAFGFIQNSLGELIRSGTTPRV